MKFNICWGEFSVIGEYILTLVFVTTFFSPYLDFVLIMGENFTYLIKNYEF